MSNTSTTAASETTPSEPSDDRALTAEAEPRFSPLHAGLAVSLVACSLLGSVLCPATTLERERAGLEGGPVSFPEYISLRRDYFFGHREMSDELTGFDVIGASVNMYAARKEARTGKLRQKFEATFDDIRFLSRFSIGMNDVYVIPAMFLLFEDENPKDALPILDLGVGDKKTSAVIPVMAAFIYEAFYRDPKKAGEYYVKAGTYPNMPPFYTDLGKRLLAGDDPFETEPAVRKQICKSVLVGFPKAREYFKKNLSKCAGVLANEHLENSQP